MTMNTITGFKQDFKPEHEANSTNSQQSIGIEDGCEPKKGGMSVLITVLFVAGENAGCALLALPYALNESGWYGLALLIMCCVDSAICGALIGKCWLILEERWPQFRGHCRYPYPAIGKMAYGNWMRNVVTICLQITLIGSAVVVLLICAQLVSTIFNNYLGLSYGLWILGLGLALCPFMWLGTPGEFWPAAAGALLTTMVAVILLMVDMIQDFTKLNKPPPVSEPDFSTACLAFGTFLFAYGGTAAFPTFQNDMKNKSKFSYAVIIGFSILIMMYVPFATMGYITYGSGVKNNIILSVPGGLKRDIAMLLMSGHLFFAFLLLINAPVQEIENKFNVPNEFGWKRVIVRIIVLAFIIFIGETIPHFGKILDLLGGSTIAMVSYILPPLFYIKLCSDKSEIWPERKISTLEKLYYYKIIVTGLVGGISCTFWALKAILSPDALTAPCYIDSSCSNE